MIVSMIARLLLGHLGSLDSHKTVIGAVLTVVAFGIDMAGMTDSPVWNMVLDVLQAMGIGATGVGLGHRAGKEGIGVKKKT